MKAVCRVMLSLLCVFALPVCAQGDAKQPWEEYDRLIKNREEIAALGPTLFGDQVNLMNGALSFSMTDISVPGNSASLPMAITRTYTVSNRKGYRVNDLPLADWDLDLPRISGVFGPRGSGFGTPCTATTAAQAMPPQLRVGQTFFSPEDYWQGNQASMPGGGEMLMANSGAPSPGRGGPYYWMTSEFTYFSCLPNIKNGPGEGFLGITKDGTKYWFDSMASYQEPDLRGSKGTERIVRSKRVLYATRVQDRFGNAVTYTFTNSNKAPARLTRIDSSDGRAITLTYNSHGHVATVSNGTQTFNYQYSYPSEGKGTLTEVIWPGADPVSKWVIDFGALTNAVIRYEKPHCVPTGLGQLCDPIRSCGDPGPVITPGAVGTITHPSGARGEFTVEPVRHGRSNVPMVCNGYTDPYNDPNDDTAYYPLNYDALSVVKKSVTGPALTPSEWTYNYYSDIRFAEGTGPVCTSSNCGAVVCTSDACAGTAVTVLTGPDGLWERHTFGNSYRYNEGKLLKVETGTGPDAILKTEATAYQLAQSGQPFATPIGHSPQSRGDGFTSEYLRPQLQKTIFQDGATFTNLVTGFDGFARPLGATKSSSLGYTKTDAIEYHDDIEKWVVGQVKRQISADNGEVMTQVDYAPDSALPVRQSRFGKVDWTLAYNADGTLAFAKDGRENPTAMQGWSRGIPTTIGHADGSVESARVNAGTGWIDSVTDENDYRTSYSYDPMGRVNRTSFPAFDTPLANDINTDFRTQLSAQWGLPAGAWYRITRDGAYAKDQFYDGLWRPVFEIERDTYDPNTVRYRSRAFDALGREAFVSYPSTTAAAYNSLTQGTRTFYDVLGRVIRTEQDSEHGLLITRTEYLPGFQRRIINPRNQSTLQQFQAYDEPSYDAPVRQDSPEGVTTTIVRDRYLKPLDVTRSGPEG